MKIAQKLVPELKYEASNTRKVFERLPDEFFSWKPHEKSFSLGGLASHISNLASWVTICLNTEEFDLATGSISKSTANSFKEIISTFESKLNTAVSVMNEVSDERIHSPWILRKGQIKVFELPRIAVVRNLVINHTIHHRGELIVYMRLLNLKVPGLYGPSADEQ